jgi:thioredoxin
MLRLLIGIAIGAGIGAAIGSIGTCATGTCPFTSTWWGGAIFGGLFGLIIANAISGVPSTPSHLSNVVDLQAGSAFNATLAQAGDTPVLVDFYLNSCPPCRALAPELYSVAGERPDSLMVLKVNAGTHRELAGQFNVQGVPTLVLIKNGETVARETGYMKADALKKWLDGALMVTE